MGDVEHGLTGQQCQCRRVDLEDRAPVEIGGAEATILDGLKSQLMAPDLFKAFADSFDDLMEHGSEAAIKAAGKLRVEGKEYVVQDGDMCYFLIGN